MMQEVPRIKVEGSGSENESYNRSKSHTPRARSVSSQVSEASSSQPSKNSSTSNVKAMGSVLAPPAGQINVKSSDILQAPKKTPVTNFKVEAEIVNTGTSKSVSLFDYAESGASSASNSILNAVKNDTGDRIVNEVASGYQQPLAGTDTATNSDSEETFVYDTQKPVVDLKADEATNMVDADNRPILVHKNSMRSSFKLAGNNNTPARAFSQTVLADNESIASKNPAMSQAQRRIPTLQQPAPQIVGGSHAAAGQRFGSRAVPHHMSASPQISSGSALRFHPSGMNSQNNDNDSYHSTAFTRPDGDETTDSIDEVTSTDNQTIPSFFDNTDTIDDNSDYAHVTHDESNTTLKQERPQIGSFEKSHSEPLLLLSDRRTNGSPGKSRRTKNMIVSQVRNVSKTLFDNEKNYLKKKLSYGSLKEDDEVSLVLHNHHQDYSSNDGFPGYYGTFNHSQTAINNNNNNNNRTFPNDSEEFEEHWNAQMYSHGTGFDKRHSQSRNYQGHPSYDSVNPHNYISKYQKKNAYLKAFSSTLKWILIFTVIFSLAKIATMKYLTNPILDFKVDKIEKLIIADNLLIFDINCSSTNINLQQVTIDQGDIDVFITYKNAEQLEKSILLGNISHFFVPLTFQGLLSNEDLQLKDLFNSSLTRNLVQHSTGQMKLSGEFKEIDTDIERIISKPFELNLRGSFKYKLPFTSSLNLINISKKYVHKEEKGSFITN